MSEFNPWVGKIPWSRKWQPTIDREAWQATVHGLTESDLTEHNIHTRIIITNIYFVPM